MKSFQLINSTNSNNPFLIIISFINNYYIYVCITLIFSALFMSNLKAQEVSSEFMQDQLRYERVRSAFEEKEQSLKNSFDAKGITWPPNDIFLRAFKAEAVLELWVKNDAEGFELYNSYKICKSSGNFGPKRKSGDRQVPEGLYYIDRFNPTSKFWLSLGLNYPNESDRILSDASAPGGDIFIHGDCVTIGCLPMTDEYMKEIYILAVQAKNNGQDKIEVHSFPFRFNALNKYIFFKEFPQHRKFWENLEEAYDRFEIQNTLPNYSVDSKGAYLIETS